MRRKACGLRLGQENHTYVGVKPRQCGSELAWLRCSLARLRGSLARLRGSLAWLRGSLARLRGSLAWLR